MKLEVGQVWTPADDGRPRFIRAQKIAWIGYRFDDTGNPNDLLWVRDRMFAHWITSTGAKVSRG